ncbi:MAG TPA: hypothetical protein VJA21_25945, partial [Verrucomicrobiae bacterium]
RAEGRGSPDLGYYEGLGRAQYSLASEHRLARRYELTSILSTLSDRFAATRLALNEITDRLFSLGDTDYSLEKLLAPAGSREPG